LSEQNIKKEVGGKNDMFENVVVDNGINYDLSNITFDPEDNDEVLTYDDEELLRKALGLE
jgi:hypothetical protein